MDFITGVLQIANFFLAVVAGLIAATLFEVSKEKQLRAWKPLAVALVFFALEEVFGGLRSFNIYTSTWITHVIPSIILIFLIYGLALQIYTVEVSK